MKNAILAYEKGGYASKQLRKIALEVVCNTYYTPASPDAVS